ncbi:MAG: hypothetical protein ACPLYD_16900, partial [Anaerolineae bacterium]
MRAEIRALMRLARRLEEKGNLPGALEAYREALDQASQDPDAAALLHELRLIVNDLQSKAPVAVPPSPAAIVSSVPPAEDSLDALFDQAQDAMQREEWVKAYALFQAVYERQPDYQRNGQKVWLLRQKADYHLRQVLESWKELQRFTLKKGWLSSLPTVWSVVFASDGKTLYAGCDDGTIWEMDVESEEALWWENGNSSAVYSVTCSRDNILATASGEGSVQLWSKDGDLLRTLEEHTDAVESVVFSSDGNILASASDDKRVCLWRVADGNLLNKLEHKDAVTDVAISPDNRLLVAASDDGTIWLWRLNDARLIKIFEG